MFAFFKLLFALKIGLIPAMSGPARVELRAESREAAAETAARAFAELRRSPWEGAAIGWPQPPTGVQAGPSPGPVFLPQRCEEWLAHFASDPKVKDLAITQAALWAVKSPVRVNVSSQHFYLSWTLRTP